MLGYKKELTRSSAQKVMHGFHGLYIMRNLLRFPGSVRAIQAASSNFKNNAKIVPDESMQLCPTHGSI